MSPVFSLSHMCVQGSVDDGEQMDTKRSELLTRLLSVRGIVHDCILLDVLCKSVKQIVFQLKISTFVLILDFHCVQRVCGWV